MCDLLAFSNRSVLCYDVLESMLAQVRQTLFGKNWTRKLCRRKARIFFYVISLALSRLQYRSLSAKPYISGSMSPGGSVLVL